MTPTANNNSIIPIPTISSTGLSPVTFIRPKSFHCQEKLRRCQPARGEIPDLALGLPSTQKPGLPRAKRSYQEKEAELRHAGYVACAVFARRSSVLSCSP